MKTRTYLIIFLAAVLSVFLAGCNTFSAPQGPSLELTLTNVAAPPTLVRATATPVPTQTPPIPTPKAAPASSSVCNKTGSMIILVTGYDQTIEVPYGADFIRYIKADFDQPSVTIVAVPRDIWLKTTALQAQSIKQTTIGRLFYYSYGAAVGQPTDKLLTATTALTQTLYDAFSVVPDHYVTVNLYSFAQLVDALGGVNVNIPEDLRGPSYTFYTGDQLLNGNSALLYVRALPYNATEWERMKRQNLVLKALRDEVFSPAILPKIPDLIKIYRTNLVTDLSFAQFADLACLVNQVSLEKFIYSSVSPDMVSPGPQGSMLPDIETVKAFMQKQLGSK